MAWAKTMPPSGIRRPASEAMSEVIEARDEKESKLSILGNGFTRECRRSAVWIQKSGAPG
jgi:hypothetical protein